MWPKGADGGAVGGLLLFQASRECTNMSWEEHRGLPVDAAARLSYPNGIAIDRAGSIYIADSQDHFIREVSQDGNINSVAGNGFISYSGDVGGSHDST